MEYKAEFFSACSRCGWEEDGTHPLLIDCCTEACPKCGNTGLFKEVQISRIKDDGSPFPVHRTHHRYGKIKLVNLNPVSVDKKDA